MQLKAKRQTFHETNEIIVLVGLNYINESSVGSDVELMKLRTNQRDISKVRLIEHVGRSIVNM